MVFSILPKNKRNSLSWVKKMLRIVSLFIFWENWGDHKLFSRFTDLYFVPALLRYLSQIQDTWLRVPQNHFIPQHQTWYKSKENLMEEEKEPLDVTKGNHDFTFHVLKLLQNVSTYAYSERHINSRCEAIRGSGGSQEFSRSVHPIQTIMPNTLLQPPRIQKAIYTSE